MKSSPTIREDISLSTSLRNPSNSGRFRKPLNKLIVPLDLFLEIEQALLLQIQKLPGFEGVRIYPDNDIMEVSLILFNPGGELLDEVYGLAGLGGLNNDRETARSTHSERVEHVA